MRFFLIFLALASLLTSSNVFAAPEQTDSQSDILPFAVDFDSESVADLQNALLEAGYEPGAANGRYGQTTADAVAAYQADWGMEVTGDIDQALYEHITGIGPETAPDWSTIEPDACAVWDIWRWAQRTIKWDGACVEGLVAGPGQLEIEWTVLGVRQTLIYSVNFKNGLLDGPFTSRESTGFETEGHFVEGDAHGLFKVLQPDGVRLELTYIDGVPGTQTVFMPNVGVARGDFLNPDASGFIAIQAADGSSYRGEAQAGIPHGMGRFVDIDGTIIEGQFVFGALHGKGRYVSTDGRIYRGDFVNGTPEGMGVTLHPDGQVFAGEVRAGAPHGFGVRNMPNRDGYEGAYTEGRPNGHGRMAYADGNLYRGQMRMGDRHGFGVFSRPDGYRYVGEYRDDRRDGLGYMDHSNGDWSIGAYRDGFRNGYNYYAHASGTKYWGEFQNGVRHGEGRLLELGPTGRLYEGGFWNDQPEGKAVVIWNDGAHFTGEYANGLYHGYGDLLMANGWRYEGEFRFNEPAGNGRFTTPAGAFYTGEFSGRWHILGGGEYSNPVSGVHYKGEFGKGLKFHGQGRVTSADGSVYEGDFVAGKLHGHGQLRYRDGTEYVGEFQDGKKHGYGVLEYSAGARYRGAFRDGRENGQGTVTLNTGDIYSGSFVEHWPQGAGELLVGGKTYKGEWRKGCFRQGDFVYAIGRSMADCRTETAAIDAPTSATPTPNPAPIRP